MSEKVGISSDIEEQKDKMVGGAGFELATLCSQNRCATTALTPEDIMR
jgi:hypothetical protein